MTRVVIVGGGFAGLNAAKVLARSREIELTLIDQRNHHLFQPLLYQVAMAGLSPAEIAAPIRSLLSAHRNARVRDRKQSAASTRRAGVSTRMDTLGAFHVRCKLPAFAAPARVPGHGAGLLRLPLHRPGGEGRAHQVAGGPPRSRC